MLRAFSSWSCTCESSLYHIIFAPACLSSASSKEISHIKVSDEVSIGFSYWAIFMSTACHLYPPSVSVIGHRGVTALSCARLWVLLYDAICAFVSYSGFSYEKCRFLTKYVFLLYRYVLKQDWRLSFSFYLDCHHRSRIHKYLAGFQLAVCIPSDAHKYAYTHNTLHMPLFFQELSLEVLWWIHLAT